jgi:NADPH:quinone reductase-like Zn-dependent oxidoreductase
MVEMKAAVIRQAGGPEVLHVEAWPIPEPTREQVLIRVKAFGLNKWWFDQFSPMDVIPTAVNLTVYSGGSQDFMRTPLRDLVAQVEAGTLRVPTGKVFRLDQIAEAHRCMDSDNAGGKIVVLTS